jgi:ribonuclease BN (tRNA processing enzyme)
VTLALRVLGSEPAWPSAGRACTGFLLETPGGPVLVDCGTGIFERLRAVLPPERLRAVIISHLHFDHWADLIPFRYYLSFGARPERPPTLHLPPGAVEVLQRVIEPVDPDPRFFADAFETFEYDPEGTLEIGSLEISFRKTVHPVDTYALMVRTSGASLAYSADTGWDPSLADFVCGADLFLCEAGWGADGRAAGDMHLSGAEAGRLARMGGVERLLLTHVAEPEAPVTVRCARREYRGPVDYAAPGLTVRI